MKFIILLFLVLLAGCDCKRSACLSNIGRYTDNYQMWERPGKDESDLNILKAYLECGGTHPYSYLGEDGIPIDLNGFVLTERCMENSGYVHVAYVDRKPTCSQEWNKKYPACQPGAVVPTPSVERRLNGAFCKRHPKNQACEE